MEQKTNIIPQAASTIAVDQEIHGAPDRYMRLDNRTIPLTEEMYRACVAFINSERKHARALHACAQPDYSHCGGDCGLCRWASVGSRYELDAYNDGNTRLEEIANADGMNPVEEYVVGKLICSAVYEFASQIVCGGAQVLYLYAEEGQSVRAIAEVLHISKTAVHYRLNKVIAEIRVNREVLFGD